MLLVTYGEKDRITRPEQWFSFAVVPPLAVGVAGWLIHVLLRWLRQYWAGR